LAEKRAKPRKKHGRSGGETIQRKNVVPRSWHRRGQGRSDGIEKNRRGGGIKRRFDKSPRDRPGDVVKTAVQDYQGHKPGFGKQGGSS